MVKILFFVNFLRDGQAIQNLEILMVLVNIAKKIFFTFALRKPTGED